MTDSSFRFIYTISLSSMKAKNEAKEILMLMNRTKERGRRGQRATTIWSVVTVVPGAALRAYCPSSIPAEKSFGGMLKAGHEGREKSLGFIDNRQLQM